MVTDSGCLTCHYDLTDKLFRQQIAVCLIVSCWLSTLNFSIL